MSSGQPTQSPGHRPWSTMDALALYQVPAWGKEYFSVNDDGHLVVRPDATSGREIDLHEVIQGLAARDLRTPVVVRFSDILAHRLKRLHDVFAHAIADNEYRNHYAAVYPIKVNQQRLVVEEVFRYGQPYGFGLEVGSKPELLSVMAMTENSQDRLIICNGFKDSSYIEAVILATRLGRTIIPVVENFSELELILRHADTHGVRPRIGVRVKLASDGPGRWQQSAGDRSKFGLSTTEILEAVRILRERDMLDCLQLVHCHPGSQLQDIRQVTEAVNEMAHVYVGLRDLGAGLRYIDIGGGLGVDYDGSSTNSASSMNYTLAEYASNVVYRIASICNQHGVDHPAIISESGRAIAAHHSVLVFDVLGASTMDRHHVQPGDLPDPEDHALPQPIRDLIDAFGSVSPDNPRRLVECYHDAATARDQALQMFKLGLLSMPHRGLVERLYWTTCTRIRDAARHLETVPEELAGLETILSDIYFCNFSVFQSLPDSWAIDQLFPIMPIHRLDEEPVRRAVLADITCDSDGKIDAFVGSRPTLEVHPLRRGEDYYLAAFLVGAYQETLGDLHNLFGDTHVVHIRLHDEGGWWIEEIVKGDTANRVLEYMEYDVAELYPALMRDCERAVRAGRMTLAQSQALKRFYEAELDGYAYLEP